MGGVGGAGGGGVGGCAGAAALLTASPPACLAAQDPSVVAGGVRVGIIYRPGVRPGMVLLPGRPGVLDSVRAIVARDLDYRDRFEMITLPGGDSIRLGAAANPPRSSGRGRTGGGGGEAAGLNSPLFQALGADFAVALAQATDTTVVTLHDVAAGGVRREVKKRLPPLTSPDFRLAVHRLAHQVLQASLGAPGVAASPPPFLMGRKVWQNHHESARQR